MRLLDTRTADFRSVDDPRQATYAILSHVWARAGEGCPEQTFEDIQKIHKRRKTIKRLWLTAILKLNKRERLPSRLSEKIRRCCAIAKEHGFDSIWVDTCCIDKSSSSELSEAINSMFSWYKHAKVCYAYLHDVDDDDEPSAPGSQFRRSRWFSRGWTLQELIAPRVLIFISKGWRALGTKATLAAAIEEVTGIDSAILTNEVALDTVSVARRISWASRRQTTRVEDEAYSLMGILDVNLPTIYGEGRFAFIRLQEEVLKQTADQSLLLWGPALRDSVEPLDGDASPERAGLEELEHTIWAAENMRNLFALSPRDFALSTNTAVLSRQSFRETLNIDCPLPEYTTTGHGIRTTVPLLTIKNRHSGVSIHLAILACQDAAGQFLALILQSQGFTQNEYFVGAFLSPWMSIYDDGPDLGGHPGGDSAIDILLGESYFRNTHLSPQFVATHRDDIRLQEIYIPHRPSRARTQALPGYREINRALCMCPGMFKVDLTGWSASLLGSAGFAVSALSDDPHWNTVSTKRGFVFAREGREIRVEIDRCSCESGLVRRWLRVVVSTPPSQPTPRIPDTPSHFSSPSRLATPPVHNRNHPDHVRSWFLDAGVASRQTHLCFSDGKKLTLLLTLSLVSLGGALHDRQYALGVETVDRPAASQEGTLVGDELVSS